MTAPGRQHVMHVMPGYEGTPPEPPRWRRGWQRAGRVGRAAATWVTRPARLLPGLAAVGCAVAGSYVLWGVGVALLVAAGFLLLLDARTPRG